MLNYSILIYYTLLTTNFSSSAEFFSTRDYGYIRYSIPEKKEGALGIKLQISWFFTKTLTIVSTSISTTFFLLVPNKGTFILFMFSSLVPDTKRKQISWRKLHHSYFYFLKFFLISYHISDDITNISTCGCAYGKVSARTAMLKLFNIKSLTILWLRMLTYKGMCKKLSPSNYACIHIIS